jgi:hypothetical protein
MRRTCTTPPPHSPDWCIGQLRLPNCQADTGLTDMSIEDAVAKGARTMVVGVVNAGGVLPDHWIAEIVKAIEAGMNVATGLHKRLSSIPEIAEAAARHGAKLHDVRFSDMPSPPARAPGAPASVYSPSAPIARSARNTPPWRWMKKCASAA